MGNRDRERNRLGSGESEHESLLIHETPSKYIRHKQSLHLCTESGRGEKEFKCTITYNFNSYIFFSFHFCFVYGFIEEADSGAGVTSTKPLHGTNNYELTELDTRGPTYRYAKINLTHPIHLMFPI